MQGATSARCFNPIRSASRSACRRLGLTTSGRRELDHLFWPATSSGGGGGGIPDAPADQFYYGRHQGDGMVAEEAPIDGQTYGRQSTAWTPTRRPLRRPRPMAGPTAGATPAGSSSSRFSPTSIRRPLPASPGAYPAPFDDTTRLATTAWTCATIATEGGGVEEVPAAPFGAFAGVRGAGGATWRTSSPSTSRRSSRRRSPAIRRRRRSSNW